VRIVIRARKINQPVLYMGTITNRRKRNGRIRHSNEIAEIAETRSQQMRRLWG